MPAQRTRRTRQSRLSDDQIPPTNVSLTTDDFEAASESPTPTDTSCDSPYEPSEETVTTGRSAHGKKKPANHIPRPPNAFILFRSAFIQKQHVSSEVETSHSTLSKIIGLTWQNLPEEERQKWHAKAKLAQAEHKRKFPQYAFRPVHSKPRGSAAERRKVREAGPRDQKRCEKIAELLVHGVKGQELKAAINEFDRHHVPEIVTRFEAPITARSFSESQVKSKEASNARLRSRQLSVPAERQSLTDQKLHRFSRSPSISLELNDGFLPAITVSQRDDSPPFNYNTFSFEPIHSYATPSHPSISYGTSTQDPRSLNCSFDQALMPPLAVHDSFVGMGEWARSHSPLSTSTCSMPTTPALVGIPFPEQYGSYPAQAPSCHPSDMGYSNNFTTHPGYSDSYVADDTAFSLPPSFNYGSADLGNAYKSAPVVQADAEFSAFMASLPQYPLPACQ